MFGLGGDDEKDKLKENMEEIKDLIEDQPGGNQPQDVTQTSEQGVEGFPNQSPGSGTDESSTADFDQPEQINEDFSKEPDNQVEGIEGIDASLPDTDQEPQQTGQEPDPEAPPMTEDSQKPNNSQPITSQTENQGMDQTQPSSSEQQPRTSSQSSESSGSRDLNQQIPEPAKTKKLDVPDIERGPLFIKRQKFESAQMMIQEMKQISAEIDQVVNRLQKGIEQDRKTERQAKELLHELEDDRTGVKKIVSPEEN